ncbi:MAG: radical SAM protein [Deltaproteobacteria bacterium]|nr:radical SAM protein [Deltaproteobacteria bacterium]
MDERNTENITLFPGMAGLTRDIIERLKAQGTELISVDIMVTQKCNFHCLYCYAEGGPRRTNQLTMAEAKNIVDESAGLGVKVINMQGGEPLVWSPPDWKGKEESAFFHLVGYARDLFAGQNLPLDMVSFTDVAMITKKKAKKLADMGIALCCKLDSMDTDIQDKLLDTPGGSKKMMQGFYNLLEVGYGREDMPRISTNTVVTKLNYDGVPDVFRWSRKNNFKPFVIPVHVHGTAKKNHSIMLCGKPSGGTLNSADIKDLFERLAAIDGSEFGIHWKAESPWVENKACSRHLAGVHVRADGIVVPCSEAPDHWALGDIRKDSFKDIVSSDKVKKFRNIYSELHENNKCSPENCPLSSEEKCYGCRTRAYDDSAFNDKGEYDAFKLDPEAFFEGDPACWRTGKK